ncbi:MAG: hypothetical protein ACYTFI_28200, partial [Planctomycetota bacterium]
MQMLEVGTLGDARLLVEHAALGEEIGDAVGLEQLAHRPAVLGGGDGEQRVAGAPPEELGDTRIGLHQAMPGGRVRVGHGRAHPIEALVEAAHPLRVEARLEAVVGGLVRELHARVERAEPDGVVLGAVAEGHHLEEGGEEGVVRDRLRGGGGRPAQQSVAIAKARVGAHL